MISKVFNRKKKGLLLIFAASLCMPLIAAKDKKSAKESDEVFVKYVHPRIYEFDLVDAEKSVFLSYKADSNLFDVNIDFSKYVQDDLPQSGDKVIFYYKGYSSKDGGFVKATVLGDDGQRITDEEKTFAKNLVKKVTFDSNISFVLNSDVKKTLQLYLWSTKKNDSEQQDKVNLNFKRVKETTYTSKEVTARQKAEKNNIEIVEVPSEIKKDEDLNALISMDTPNLNDENVQSELKNILEEKQKNEEFKKNNTLQSDAESEKIEEENRLKQEKLLAEKEAEERRKDQEALEKALEAVKSKKNRGYEKEFLNDYMVSDDYEVTDESDLQDNLVASPNEVDSFGRTLLMQAAKSGNDWQVSTLLKSGADVNMKDKDGWTALMYAVRYQESLLCVELLLNAGADVKAVNNYGTSALMIASCYNNNPEVIRKLISFYSVTQKDVLKSLVLLLSESHTSEYTLLAKLDVFMELSVPLNTFYEGKTPLMYAAEFGNSTKVIKVLIDNNAMASVRSSEGKTAYDYAEENKSLKHDGNYWLLNKK